MSSSSHSLMVGAHWPSARSSCKSSVCSDGSWYPSGACERPIPHPGVSSERYRFG